MILAADYPFLEILSTMFIFFLWLIWIWTLVIILSDVFGRQELSGWGKAGWTAFLIFIPWIGVLVYLIAHGKDMGERRLEAAERSMDRQARLYASRGTG
jgi:hypothetical protein